MNWKLKKVFLSSAIIMLMLFSFKLFHVHLNKRQTFKYTRRGLVNVCNFLNRSLHDVLGLENFINEPPELHQSTYFMCICIFPDLLYSITIKSLERACSTKVVMWQQKANMSARSRTLPNAKASFCVQICK